MVTTLAPRKEFDGYQLEELLGKGGMGSVYLAFDTLLERPVAIKFIRTDKDETAHDRFMVEARAIARLQHPNVVSVYRVGEVDGIPYLVSEYIAGKPLDELKRPVPYEQVLKLSIGMACALSAAHQKGVLHRDIKPANAILSEDGEVKLLDFGIAKMIGQGTDTVARDTAPIDSTTETEFSVNPNAEVDVTKVLSLPTSMDSSEYQLTSNNKILGTPRFMAPELWLGAPASFQSDIYAFGMLIYTLLSPHHPHGGNSLLSLRNNIVNNTVPPLLEKAPHVDPIFADIIDRCLKKSPTERFTSIGDVRACLERLSGDGQDAIIPEGNPYRGLNTFNMEHRSLFFGRDSEIRLLLDRLKTNAFVLVTGDSGVGKSSLCRAGILPRIAGWFGDQRDWHTASLVPGRYPVHVLAATLSAILERPESELVDEIKADPGGVARALRAAQGKNAGFMLFIDQFEELATISTAEEADAATAFLSWLLVPSENIRVLATARGDFLSRIASLPDIGSEISRALFFLRPLSAERIEEAVVGPARMMGVSFESQELVSELVASTSEAGGALPLLQFALAELWESRDKNRAVIAADALAGMGGVAGALTRHADSVIAAILPEERAAAKQVLLNLVTSENTRALCPVDDLGATSAAEQGAIEALIRGRLLVVRDSPEGAAYEIAHEALIRGWRTLAGWLSSNAEARAARERLRTAAKEWIRLDKEKTLLWQRSQIDEIADLDASEFGAQETAFVSASKAAVRLRRITRTMLILAVPILAAAIYGAVQLRTRFEINRRVDLETAWAADSSAEIAALQKKAAAVRGEAFEQFNAQDVEKGETTWEEYLRIQADLMPLYQRVGQHLETALILDPERVHVREMFARHLYDRALLAEMRGASQEAAEHISRLALYDSDKRFSKKWLAPGIVTLSVEPEDANLSFFVYTEAEKHRLMAKTIADLPIQDGRVVLAQGSYLAVVDAPGFAEARYPFVVERNKKTEISVSLLPERAVPKGFVYIPPGRFFFGSGADEGLRRDFFHAAPIHEVETGGYLIARYETTFADWLVYLNALTESEQFTRRPRVEKGGFQGTLSVTRDDSERWRIAFQPTVKRYEAELDMPIRYQKRDRRSIQNWQRFPVFGISIADAEAYAAWLHETGRVPGARLCTDMEWERAARGSDGREYPHGHRLEKDDANFDATYDKVPEAMGPDEVGSHPASDSPFGLSDMAGNVWEWTRSSLEPDAYSARGGSYLFGRNSARITDREVTEPSFRDVSVGMRLCADTRAK